MAQERDTRQLFNIATDPYERHNLASVHPKKVEELEAKIVKLIPKMSSARYSKPLRTGWPGLGKGNEYDVFRTGWCSPII